MRTTLCGMFEEDEEIIKTMIAAQVQDVCGKIDSECTSANEQARGRLKFFASTLKCPAGSSVCTKDAQLKAKYCTTQPAIVGRDAFTCPVAGGGSVRGPDACAREGGRVNSRRGSGHSHNSLDINTAEGLSVVAAKAGRVGLAAENWGAMGNVVIIDHEDGDYTVYGHQKSLAVKSGDCVAAGQQIGTVGYTGNAQCLRVNHLIAHLHFAIIRAGKIGLAGSAAPISTAIKNSEDWFDISRDFFQNDMLDIGIKDPEIFLRRVPGCLR